MSVLKGIVFTVLFLLFFWAYFKFVPEGARKMFNILVILGSIFGGAIILLVRGKVYNDL